VFLILGLLGIATGLIHYLTKKCLASKCNEVSLCGILSIKRNVQVEQTIHEFDVEHNVRDSTSSSNGDLENAINTVQNIQQQQK